MSNFTPLVHKEYEFEGDKISVSFSRLKRKHMMNLLPAVLSAQTEEGQLKGDSIAEILEFGDTIADEYIQKFDGLKDVEGHVIDAKTVFTEFYFVTLASEILNDLIQESMVNSKNN